MTLAGSKPYRKIARFVLVHGGRLVAQKAQNHLVLPGGGVDRGESVSDAGRREALEETGAIVTSLVPFQVVRVEWTREWASTPKRRERMKAFKGEEEHIFVGKVSGFQKPTSTEGDAWSGRRTMTLEAALRHSQMTIESQTPAFKVLVMAKMCAIRAAQLMNALPVR